MPIPNYCLYCGKLKNNTNSIFCIGCYDMLVEINEYEILNDKTQLKNKMNPFYPLPPSPFNEVDYSLYNFPYLSDNDFGVFDFETTKIEVTKNQKFIVGGVYVYNKLYISDHIPNIIDFMIQSEKKIFFAHYLSFDFRFIFEYLNENYKLEIIPVGSNILQVKVRTDKKVLFEMRDSMRLYNHSLHSACQSYCKHYFKKNLNLAEIEFDKFDKEHLDYLHNDCLATYEFICNILKFLEV